MIRDFIGTGVRWFLIAVFVFLLVQHTDTVIGLATTAVDAAKSAASGIARFADHVGGAASEKPAVKKPTHAE